MQVVGDPVHGPETDFVSVLNRVLPAKFLLDSDAENSDDRLGAHGGSKFLTVLSVFPGRRETASRLAICKQGGREFADTLHIEFAGGAAAGIRDVTGVGIEFANLAVPELPEFEQAILFPFDIGS